MNEISPILYSDDELQAAAQRCANWYAKYCNDNFVGCNIKLPVVLDFMIAEEYPKYAGNASRDGTIGINMVLFRDYPDHILNQTIPHEVGHQAKNQIFDKHGVDNLTDHGPEWQEIMRRLGKDPLKYHDLDVSKSIAFAKQAKKNKKRAAKDEEDDE